MITIQGLQIIHNIKITKEPKPIRDLFKTHKENSRKETKLHPIYTPKTVHLKKSMIYIMTDIYNIIDTDFCTYTKTKFKKLISNFLNIERYLLLILFTEMNFYLELI